MICARSASVSMYFVLITVQVLGTGRAGAEPTVWYGLSHTFTRSSGFDSSLPENQDRITPNVWLTRDGTAGIYNRKTESFYDQNDFTSPAGTLWATSFNNPNVVDLPEVLTDGLRSTNYENLNFAPWREAFVGGVGALPDNLLGSDAVVHLLAPDDIYLEIRFTAWNGVGNPSFTYLRSVAPGDYNGDGTVNAADYVVWRNTAGQMPDRPGDGADIDRSGVVDLGDYTFWANHYGESVAGAGASAGQFDSSVVPEPTAIALVAMPLVGLVTLRRRRKALGQCPGKLPGRAP